jgi:hypothetical protein
MTNDQQWSQFRGLRLVGFRFSEAKGSFAHPLIRDAAPRYRASFRDSQALSSSRPAVFRFNEKLRHHIVHRAAPQEGAFAVRHLTKCERA